MGKPRQLPANLDISVTNENGFNQAILIFEFNTFLMIFTQLANWTKSTVYWLEINNDTIVFSELLYRQNSNLSCIWWRLHDLFCYFPFYYCDTALKQAIKR